MKNSIRGVENRGAPTLLEKEIEMGCDIHAHIEIKVNSEWLYYTQADIERSYNTFAKMAGVRNFQDNITPIAWGRGLPIDISLMTKLHRKYWGLDGHSDSWLTYDEIVSLIDWMSDDNEGGFQSPEYIFFGERVYLFGNTVYCWKKYPDEYPDFIEDIRLVFWFDN